MAVFTLILLVGVGLWSPTFLFVSTLVFGLMSVVIILIKWTNLDNYRALVFPILLHPAITFCLAFGNFFLALVSCILVVYFVFGAASAVFIEALLWVHIVLTGVILIPTIFWYVAALRLTPKQGTMVVDEEHDAYYLPGEELPRFMPYMKIITPKTKIFVAVTRQLGDVHLKFSRSFCFAPEVFTEEARRKLPGSMWYSTNVKTAEAEFLAAYPDLNTTVWKLFQMNKKVIGSPYLLWNRDIAISSVSE